MILKPRVQMDEATYAVARDLHTREESHFRISDLVGLQ